MTDSILTLLTCGGWFYLGYLWAGRRHRREKAVEREAMILAKHWAVADLTQDVHERDQVEAKLRRIGYTVTRRGFNVVVSKL